MSLPRTRLPVKLDSIAGLCLDIDKLLPAVMQRLESDVFTVKPSGWALVDMGQAPIIEQDWIRGPPSGLGEKRNSHLTPSPT